MAVALFGGVRFWLALFLMSCGDDVALAPDAAPIDGAPAIDAALPQADAAPMPDAPAPLHRIWIVFGPSAIRRDLPGLFQCLLLRTDFNDRASSYAGGYGLAWGGAANASCVGDQYDCAVAALRSAGFAPGDHDVVEIIVHGYCGGDNNAHADGVVAGGIRIRGANVGDCASFPQAEERVAVHEAFEACGHWANADCCTGEVSTSCPDMGESFCPDCPCTCGQFAADSSYGGYTLDCGGGHTYWSQRVPSASSREYDPAACSPFTLR